jgi:acetolactate synthase-1/2/3 large subunit
MALEPRNDATAKTFTGGQILIEALRRQGVDRVYCVPGESYLQVLDALHDAPEIAVVSAGLHTHDPVHRPGRAPCTRS